ncbi:hypothetical protein AZE42_10221 [Rhizopogon vesiculosus]|uniref:Uncharacterized protein n=1 Tax=Rhizopogon vesiculosus TaxID=180088 RepID=A0A1J8QJR5_9AGAM|nr:hypothetical protein AZE42_10221 [Rhizopogon vesiculosus]
MEMTLGGVSLLALFLETLFYGAACSSLCTATLLLCLATAHLIIDFIRALEAFVFQVNTVGADGYYSNLALPLELAKMALYVTQTILADSVILWRCYVIFNRSLLIAIPGCVILLTNGGELLEMHSVSLNPRDPAAIGCFIVWSLSQIHSGSFAPATLWMNLFYVLTMAISNTCTISIACRIYRTRRFMLGGLATLLPIFIVIVESGALYALSVIALLVTLVDGSNGQYVMLDIVVPIMGITFCLIILQVHFHVGGNTPTEQSAERTGIVFRGQSVRDVEPPVTVHITEETEVVHSDVMRRLKDQLPSGNIF